MSMPGARSFSKGRISRAAFAGFAVSLISLALVAGGYTALMAGLLPEMAAFRTFRAGVELSFIAFAISLMGWRYTRQAPGRKMAVVGIAISLLILAPMSPLIVKAFSVPPIHDITTDTDNPPLFDALLAQRAQSPNISDYGGEALAAMQKAAYPDIAPLHLPIAPQEAFLRAQKLVESRGWTVAAADAAAGRIEATSITKMMRFKDDVVIRITQSGEGSIVDMRSVSRLGKSDVGVNAERIRAFLKELAGA